MAVSLKEQLVSKSGFIFTIFKSMNASTIAIFLENIWPELRF